MKKSRRTVLIRRLYDSFTSPYLCAQHWHWNPVNIHVTCLGHRVSSYALFKWADTVLCPRKGFLLFANQTIFLGRRVNRFCFSSHWEIFMSCHFFILLYYGFDFLKSFPSFCLYCMELLSWHQFDFQDILIRKTNRKTNVNIKYHYIEKEDCTFICFLIYSLCIL